MKAEDLQAEVFSYEVIIWTEQRLEAVARGAMVDCLDRVLHVDIAANSASLKWMPTEGCEGDTGAAVLIGDPV